MQGLRRCRKPIWTPDALRSEVRGYAGRAWRIVEAQHRVSTLKLVDNLAEQAALEDILEATKPPLPPECRALDYSSVHALSLSSLSGRFAVSPAGLTAGVWYGAETPQTAAAEMVFYRFLFYAESPDTPFPDDAAEYTAFAAGTGHASGAGSDGRGPRGGCRLVPSDRLYYCQALAEAARQAGVEILRYASVRDPAGGMNLAVLTCNAFAQPQPAERQTWRIRIGPCGRAGLARAPRLGLEFPPGSFAPDPRLSGMNWNRPRAR